MLVLCARWHQVLVRSPLWHRWPRATRVAIGRQFAHSFGEVVTEARPIHGIDWPAPEFSTSLNESVLQYSLAKDHLGSRINWGSRGAISPAGDPGSFASMPENAAGAI